MNMNTEVDSLQMDICWSTQYSVAGKKKCLVIVAHLGQHSRETQSLTLPDVAPMALGGTTNPDVDGTPPSPAAAASTAHVLIAPNKVKGL